VTRAAGEVLYRAPAPEPGDARGGRLLIGLGVLAMLAAFVIVLRLARRGGPAPRAREEDRDE
jgi:hypothetical protein